MCAVSIYIVAYLSRNIKNKLSSSLMYLYVYPEEDEDGTKYKMHVIAHFSAFLPRIETG